MLQYWFVFTEQYLLSHKNPDPFSLKKYYREYKTDQMDHIDHISEKTFQVPPPRVKDL